MNTTANIDFLSQQNTQLLWEVLLEHDIVQKTNQQILKQFIPTFKPNMGAFYNSEKSKNYDLINLNKLFLKNILNVFQTFVYSTQQQNQLQSQEFKKIKIGNEEVGEVYKIEDIQNQRLNDFERELSKKVNDFENFIKPKMPAPLDFSDKKEDTKIGGEINLLIEQTIAQRNYDIQQIQNTLMENPNQGDEWLKSQNTSLKNDKINLNVKDTTTVKKNTIVKKDTSIKNFPNKNNEKIIPKKNISWDDTMNQTLFYDNTYNQVLDNSNSNSNSLKNISNNNIQNQNEGLFFSKLKKIGEFEMNKEEEFYEDKDNKHREKKQNEEIQLLKELHEKINNLKIYFEEKFDILLHAIEKNNTNITKE